VEGSIGLCKALIQAPEQGS